MKITDSHKRLQSMFPELVDAIPVDESSTSSWNDGGNTVSTLWEGPGQHYRTTYNDWLIEHPDTTISRIRRRRIETWVEEVQTTKKYSERTYD